MQGLQEREALAREELEAHRRLDLDDAGLMKSSVRPTMGSCGRESEREQRDVSHGKKKGGREREGSRGRPGPRVADDEVARWRSARALLLAMRSRRRQGEVVDGLDWWLDRVDRGDASSAGWVRRGSEIGRAHV